MKIGDKEVVQLMARNAEMRRVFQGEDKIYEKPFPVVENEDYVSPRRKDHNPGFMISISIPTNEFYPLYISKMEFTARCRFNKLEQYETKDKTIYRHTDGIYTKVLPSLQAIAYMPGLVSIIGAQQQWYPNSSTYCDCQLYALPVDTSTHLIRSTSGYSYCEWDNETSSFEIVDEFKINTERYADCSTGFVFYDAGKINGTSIYVKTNFCPAENTYHTYKAYVEITEDSNNNIIIPHLVIDSSDYSNTFTFDKSISIENYVYDSTSPLIMFGRNNHIPAASVQSVNNQHLVMTFDNNERDDAMNPDTRIDFASVDIKVNYELRPDLEPWTDTTNNLDYPRNLGYFSGHYIPTENTPISISNTTVPVGLYCASPTFSGFDPYANNRFNYYPFSSINSIAPRKNSEDDSLNNLYYYINK